MGAVKRAMLEWSLADICAERTEHFGALQKLPCSFPSAATRAAAFHRLLLAELHAGIKQARQLS